jgi:hypothetical protein
VGDVAGEGRGGEAGGVKEDRLSVSYHNLESLLPRLKGCAFHVTTQAAYPEIREVGRVLWNPPESIPKWKCKAHSREMQRVAICDLRAVDEERIHFAQRAYNFLDPRGAPPDPVFLLLSEIGAHHLIEYLECEREMRQMGTQLVPHIEAGYPGDLPLAHLSSAIIVDVLDRPDILGLLAGSAESVDG